ncbi:hypothetical protein SK128_011166 [Halocaridina rubra]|uniref:SET domain-containing protein n=1 Tax=Halocaridina rubra TaxID=373956 RepID=A0AAN8WXN9_HALRR
MSDSLGIDSQVQKLIAELGSNFDGVLKQYHGNLNTLDMFSLFWSLKEAHETLTPKIPISRKSKEDSEKFRKEGNKAFEKKNRSEALKLYNKSIVNAPHPPLRIGDDIQADSQQKPDYETEALSLAYANRSAVLFELQQYEDCLSDIQRAMENGYPENLRQKLIKRKESCSIALNNPSGERKRLLTRYLVKPPRISESNPAIPSLSNSVKMAVSSSVGRYLVAQREIKPGEVLAVEEIYCKSMTHQYLQTHCNTCFIRCLIPLPCPTCSEIVFCSNECREEGLSGQHRLECNILPYLGTMNTSMIIPYKILTRTPFRHLKKLLQLYKEEKESKMAGALGFNARGIYDSEDYRTMCCLVTNQEKRDQRSLFTICAGAFILTKLLLLNQEYFLDEMGSYCEPTQDDIVVVGGALFYHVMSDLSNGHRYGELQASGGSDGAPEIQNIGAWISPTLSLANHSCDQSVITCNKGNLGVMTAIQTILPGQEVTTGYLKGYGAQSVSIRREILAKHYHFECSCPACKENWPTFANLPESFQMKCWRCFHFVNRSDGQCSSCGEDYTTGGGNDTYNWKHVDEEVGLAVLGFLRMRKNFKTARLDFKYEDLKVTIKLIEIMDKYIILPNKIYANAKVFLAAQMRNQRDFVQIKEGFS